MSLGSNILILREKKLLTQEQLAEKIGVKRQSINQYEKDKIQPSQAKLALLAKALGVKISDLYSEITPTIAKEPELAYTVTDETKDEIIQLYRENVKHKDNEIEQLKQTIEALKSIEKDYETKIGILQDQVKRLEGELQKHVSLKK